MSFSIFTVIGVALTVLALKKGWGWRVFLPQGLGILVALMAWLIARSTDVQGETILLCWMQANIAPLGDMALRSPRKKIDWT